MTDRTQAIEETKKRLDALDERIADLETRAEQASEDARAEYRHRVDELKQQSEEARDRLQELREASDAAWKDVKAGLDAATARLGEALSSARARFS